MAGRKPKRPLGKSKRLFKFQQRLLAASRARSFDEAYGQICRILNEIEDQFYDRPFNPKNAATDKRLYPPLWDNIFPEPHRAKVRRLKSAAHYTLIGDNGAIEIYNVRTQQRIFSKPGADGELLE